jgi:hypothetical protein
LLLRHGTVRGAVTPDHMLDGAVAALARFIAAGPAEQRASTLLAIDALVTGAFVAAERDSDLERLARRAWHDLLALGSHA